MGRNIGWLTVPLAIFAIAQRLGNYENKPLAWTLTVLASILFGVLFGFIVRDALASWRNRNRVIPKLGPLVIDEARWVCVNDDTVYIDLTQFLQNRVDIEHDSLKVLVNNSLGDPCMKFHPELGGHSKLLNVRYSRKGSTSTIPNEWLEL